MSRREIDCRGALVSTVQPVWVVYMQSELEIDQAAASLDSGAASKQYSQQTRPTKASWFLMGGIRGAVGPTQSWPPARAASPPNLACRGDS